MKEDKIKIKIKVVKIGMLSDNRVGKTSICNSLINSEFREDQIATIGTDKYETKLLLNNGNEIKVNWLT